MGYWSSRARPGPHQGGPALDRRTRRPTLGGTDPPAVAYVYAPDRKAERPIAHLVGFRGILQTDGYEGYRVPGRVITPIVEGHPQSRLDELLPWTYTAAPDLKAVA